ncbi:YpdA family putative bacillithiol disulfide reductase [Flammeovirgaceae bacterium SG7u.111]|nr:YpdA family putative bacillithiol disulfide reductase [Flammeovirgaceae bacterium SG7u.132]WPO34252.1 YpdA family putative bacillithiol disulfide reductase [Flammeovirgaceae bacterium SG7u.111]
MSSEKEKIDVLIVGGGPIGIACGIAAKKVGLSHLILEKGCLVNSIYNYPANMTFFSTSERLEIGKVPFISHRDKPTRSEALEYFRRVQNSWELNIHFYEQVTGIEKTSGGFFQVSSSKNKTYIANKVIIATGFYDLPNKMNVPGEDLPKVHHYYDEPHPFIGQKVLVVGAANSAIDAALETWRKGAEVSLLVRGSEISSRVKYWIKPDIDNRIAEGSIPAYFESELVEIREHEVDLKTPEGMVTLENDFVIAMTGYRPDFSFLEKAGIRLGDDEYQTPVHNPETYETNVEGLFLAGVVCGGLKTSTWFIENSREHADIIIGQIAEEVK